jgi:hypothetical protein
MKNMLEVIKRSKMENMILKFIIIIILSITIILNSDTYKEMFQNENLISSKEELDTILKENKRFVTLDLTNAELTRFSLQNDETKQNEINTYKIEYDNEILLIFLSENTAITNKVRGELNTYTIEENEIKEKVLEENEDKTVMTLCFSNVNYKMQENIVKYKFLFSVGLLCILVISIFIDIYLFLNPSKTRKYKKYKKSQKKSVTK